MTFDEFLQKKKIDSGLFRSTRPDEWGKYCLLFDQMGEKSFDQHKKFYFNPLRLSFPLPFTSVPEIKTEKTLKQPLRKPIVSTEEVAENEEAQTPPPVKKLPMKAKPVVNTQEEEKTEEIQTPPPVKKLPMKAKPIVKPPED